METPVQIVVTPGSGDGHAFGLARHLRRGLQAQGCAASLLVFRELPQLRQWTRTCEATFSYLVAIGGDATLSEAAAAAVRLSVPFVPVPSGFGNLFTSVFEHPREPDDVVELLGRGDLVWADLGVAGNRMTGLARENRSSRVRGITPSSGSGGTHDSTTCDCSCTTGPPRSA